jgi:hypothetical protein
MMKKKPLIIGIVCLIVLISVIFFLFGNKNQTMILDGKEVVIPKGEVHFHPKLTIIVDGEKVIIPDDIGYRTGKTIDTHLSGMKMSPTHTHESDGTIHIENNNPASKPETLTLGYFFEVWDKTFNSLCIFEYCIDKGKIEMFVNGEANTEFEGYIMQDEDDILIEYKTNGA